MTARETFSTTLDRFQEFGQGVELMPDLLPGTALDSGPCLAFPALPAYPSRFGRAVNRPIGFDEPLYA